MSDTTMTLPKETAHHLGMNAADARAYIDRWREVEQIERLEAQAASVQERWQKLNRLVGLAQMLGLFAKPVNRKCPNCGTLLLIGCELRRTAVAQGERMDTLLQERTTPAIPKATLRALTELTGQVELGPALLITLKDAIEHRLSAVGSQIRVYKNCYAGPGISEEGKEVS